MANAALSDWSARFLKQVETFYTLESKWSAINSWDKHGIVNRAGAAPARPSEITAALELVKKAASSLLSLRTELVGILGAPDIPAATSASILSAFDKIPLGVMDPGPKLSAVQYRKQLLDWYNTNIKSLL